MKLARPVEVETAVGWLRADDHDSLLELVDLASERAPLVRIRPAGQRPRLRVVAP